MRNDCRSETERNAFDLTALRNSLDTSVQTDIASYVDIIGVRMGSKNNVGTCVPYVVH
jgi:hypothetical protein